MGVTYIAAYFDEAGEEELFHWKCVIEFDLVKYRPHITLAMTEFFSPDQLKPILEGFAATQSKIKLRVPSIGIFPDAGVLFASILCTQTLLLFHKKVWEVTKLDQNREPRAELYRPGNWIPHITLFQSYQPYALSEAVELFNTDWKPFPVVVTGLAILEDENSFASAEFELNS